MAHELESMFFVGETPWHGLGKELKEAPDTERAIIEAGLDWTVHAEPLYRIDGNPAQVRAQCVVRDTDNRVLCDHVGPDWTVLQNKDGFKWFDPWVKAGEVTLETAGSLREGSVVWILARMKRDPMVIGKGDEVLKYVLLTWGHGTMAVRAGMTGIRTVCMNTLRTAIESADSQLLKLTHTEHVVENLEKVREIMDLANAQFEATAEQYRWLASRGISELELRRYVKVVTLAEDAKKETKTEKKVIELFQTGRGAELETAKGTWWGAYNAMAEYLTLERGKDQGRRLDNLWLGSGKQINKKAFETALRLAA